MNNLFKNLRQLSKKNSDYDLEAYLDLLSSQELLLRRGYDFELNQ